MPFYEYECPSCRYYLEVLQKLSDRPLKKCPSCGKSGFKRLVSAPVFRLKGAGWYETDFKSDKEGQRNLAGPEPAEPKTEAAPPKPGAEDKGAAAKPEPSAAAAEKGKSEGASKAAETPRRARASSSGRAASPKRSARRPVRKATRGGARR